VVSKKEKEAAAKKTVKKTGETGKTTASAKKELAEEGVAQEEQKE
jgi:hypothetical protein